MAKYSTFVYSTAKYGTGDPGTQPTYTGAYLYTLNIKWAGSWVNEAGRLTKASGTRGRQFYVGKSGERFENIQPGEFTFELDNWDLRYDPYNTGGALFGSIEPGKAVQFTAIYIATKVRYRLFSGHIKDIRPTSGRNQVQVVVTDDLQWLADQDVTIPTAFQVTVDKAIGLTLDAASYPFSRAISASLCPITFFDPQQANALDTIRDLADAGLGTVFVDAYGRLKYYDRTTTGQSTTILDQAVLLKEITITQPWDTVRNKITCIANRYGYGPAEVIWRLDDVWGFPAGASTTFKIEFESAQVIQPTKGVDYTNAETIGTLIPYVGYVNVTSLFSVWLSSITTTSAMVTVRNNEVGYQYLQFLQIRGSKLVNKKISFDVSDGGSVANGPRRMRIDTPWLQDRGFAQAYATLLLNHLKSPSKDPVITLDTRPDGLGIDLLDRINLKSAKLGIDVTYDVGYIEYEWLEPTGQSFTQTFHLQNILYSTATITPQPYYPHLPPVPPVHPPVIPPVTPPGTGTTASCTQAYPAYGTQNGPYTIGGGVVENSPPPALSISAGKWFRPHDHPYRTYIDVDAVWEVFDAGAWKKDDTYDFIAIEGADIRSGIAGYGSIVGGLVSDGVRRYQFNNGGPFYCERVVFRLDPAVIGTSYVRDALVATYTIPATQSTFTPVTGLTAGDWYCASGSGSFKYRPDAGDYSAVFAAKVDGGSVGFWGQLIGTFEARALTIGGSYPFAEWVGSGVPQNGQCFFAHGTTFEIANGDFAAVGDNSGSIDVLIYSAVVTGGDKRVTIRSISLYNICDDDGTMPK